MEQKTELWENFFILLSAEKKFRSFLSRRKRSEEDPHSKDAKKSIVNMTARITYKRRYVLDALALYFLFIFAREENVGCDASAFRNVPRSRV